MIEILIVHEHTAGMRMAAQLLKSRDGFHTVSCERRCTRVIKTRSFDLVLAGDADERRMIDTLSSSSEAGIKAAVVGESGELQSSAFANGASYFFISPIDSEIFIKRLREIVKQTPESHLPRCNDVSNSGEIERLLDSLGMPRKLLGYEYLTIAISLLAHNPGLMKMLTTQVYPMIARMKSTSAACVERAIRHSVEVVWTRGRLDVINELFGYSTATEKGKPTNGEFISRLSDVIAITLNRHF